MTRNQLQYHANQEAIRANIAKEQENVRSNKAQESIKHRGLDYTARDTATKEREADIAERRNQIETAKANEIERHNKATEHIQMFEAGTKAVDTASKFIPSIL